MTNSKLTYTVPVTEVTEIISEGFICESIQVLELKSRVDEYEALDEQVLDAF